MRLQRFIEMVISIRPDIALLDGWEVSVGEDGEPFILMWDQEALGPPPTNEELESEKFKVAKEEKKEQVKQELLYRAIQQADDPDISDPFELVLSMIPALYGKIQEAHTAALGRKEGKLEHALKTGPPQPQLDSIMADFLEFYAIKEQINAAQTYTDLDSTGWSQ